MKNKPVVWLHIFFWVIMILSDLLPIMYLRLWTIEKYGTLTMITSYLHPVAFYFGYLLVYSLVRWRRKVITGILTFVFVLILVYVISPKLGSQITFVLLQSTWWIILGGAFNIIIDWLKKKNQNLTLEKENLESKLGLLRAQVSPHFLFNTLHNIDGLIANNQKAASSSLIKLSEVLRYMLYDSRPEEGVYLKQEIDHINNYLSLQKLRLQNPDLCKIEISGSPEEIKVAPLLFIPFIENAFKHSSSSGGKEAILIKFKITASMVSFHCENHFDDSDNEKDSASGIGLDNVRQRLKLLYPSKHKLVINSDNNRFKVVLEIQI
jgi:two-component system LytT family sensor kinase